jgi:hypothetical protein
MSRLANGSTFSRKPREPNVANSDHHCARFVGCNVLLSGPDWHDLEAPQPLGAVDESDNENMFIGQFINEAIRFHEQLSDGLVSKFRHNLSTVCEINEGIGSVMDFLNKGRSVKL